ncbi:hypothetical protein ABEB36_013403 [Hypothenemus hampei]|uniref:Sphingomyelin phosphodiesterase n=1 Tax=Hypothenemus hampei TaxID=57062 RepID=A0ABD1E7X9_HYPHA
MEKSIFFLAISLLSLSFLREVNSEDDEPTFEDILKHLEEQFASFLGLATYQPMEISKLKAITDELGLTSDLRTQIIQDRIMCGACQSIVRKLQLNALTILAVGTALCTLYISLSTLTISDFCLNLVRINKPILEYILRESRILTPEYACSVLLQNENCYYSSPSLTWRIDMPEWTEYNVTSYMDSFESTKNPLKILHLSDFHISFDYEIGSVSNCGYPVCCKRNLGNPLRSHNAGPWGDYNCDIPPWLFGNTMHYIKSTHKDLDLIYFTGDIIDHTIWKSSKEENSREIEATFQMLFESFPDVPLFSALGNHEAVPLNVFPPSTIRNSEFSQDWLYNVFSKSLSEKLPDQALTNIQKQGYFSILANNRLRIVVLNNNICYNLNWWLLYDTSFLKEQLEFLKLELLAAESQAQYVHIVAHVFPGNRECIEPWEANYNMLITRFAHIIKGQFFGHTHTDGLKVFYSKINGKPNNVGYNGASLTPFVKYNPNYKILYVDPNNFDILDIETYYFNLTEANKYPNRTPRWQLLYSMKEAYNFDRLSPENFDLLAQRLTEDTNLFNEYWRFYVREGDPSLQQGCNTNCRKNLIEEITRTESITYT